MIDTLAERLDLAFSPLAEGDLSDVARELEANDCLAFLCGLPYTRLRDEGAAIDAVVAPVPLGATTATYTSVLVSRTAMTLADLADRRWRIGLNGRDSLSGYVLPLSGFHTGGIDVERLEWIPTGSHRASIAAVLEGAVDLAPIDSTVLALERLADPRRLAPLAEIAVFGPLPSPPVVVTGDLRAQGDRIRELLTGLHESAEGRSILALGALERYEAVDDGLYDSVRAIDLPD